jgi:hypothetical protein
MRAWAAQGPAQRGVSRLVVYVIVTALFALLAYGLWRGWRSAQALVLVLVAANLIIGMVQLTDLGWWSAPWWLLQLAAAITIAFLLTRPTSHAWFAGPAVPARATTDPRASGANP